MILNIFVVDFYLKFLLELSSKNQGKNLLCENAENFEFIQLHIWWRKGIRVNFGADR